MMPELTDLEIDQVEYITDTVCRAMVICGAQSHVIEYAMARILVLMALSHTHGDRNAAAKFLRETFDLMKFLTKEHPYDQDAINSVVSEIFRAGGTVQ